jgi:hypothetical protein
VNSILETSAVVAERAIIYGKQYQSLNSLFVLWAWHYIANLWLSQNPLKELERDGFVKRVESALNEFADRWLITSQWAGRWTSSTAETIAGYAKRLAECAQKIRADNDPKNVTQVLRTVLETEVIALESDATNGVQAIRVSRREQVRSYYTALWLWHRLDAERWKASQVQLRTKKRTKVNLDVDHSVAHALWQKKLEGGLPAGIAEAADALPIVNRLGNCALLEKNFNISKGAQTLKSFLDEVEEFKKGIWTLDTWAKALAIPESMLDPATADVTSIATEIDKRDKEIRDELIQFVRGTRTRVDV